MGWLFFNSVLININCMLRFGGCLAAFTHNFERFKQVVRSCLRQVMPRRQRKCVGTGFYSLRDSSGARSPLRSAQIVRF